MRTTTADRITDFRHGLDHIELTGGLDYGDLAIDRSHDLAGSDGLDTVIRIEDTNEIVAILLDTTSLSSGDFL